MVDYQQILLTEYIGVEGGEILEDPFWDIALEKFEDQSPEDQECCKSADCYERISSCGFCYPNGCIVADRIQQEMNICWDIRRYSEEIMRSKWDWINAS